MCWADKSVTGNQRHKAVRRCRQLSLALAGALLFAAALAWDTGAPRAQGGDSAEEMFEDHISEPIVQSRCIKCHVPGGVSGHTRLVLAPSTAANHETLNLLTFKSLLGAVADDGGASYVLNKIQGVAHGGGVQVPAGSSDFANMEWFLQLLAGGGDTATASLTADTLFDTVRLAPHWKTLRRAALIFAGRLPTDEEYAAVEGGGESDLRTTVRGLMAGTGFHQFLLRGSNDRLLTARRAGDLLNNPSLVVFTNEDYRYSVDVYEGRIERREHWRWAGFVDYGVRQAPLQLIAHVAGNDLPYTEILTADYVMANAWSASAYGASTTFSDPADPYEFRPSRIVEFYLKGEDFEIDHHPVTGYLRVVDPGPLRMVFPHAGLLNTISFLNRYPTTATNRNRARARWTYYHFLGVDIEKSASRTTDPVALADTNNPTMHNPNCTVCHTVMDPVAGAFQNYSEEGHYKWHGEDSLDRFYKDNRKSSLSIQADSWANRETLIWPVWLAADTETLRVVFANNFYDADTGEDGTIFLDWLKVVDADGQVIASHEFEALGPPIAPWGPCGEVLQNPATGRRDHLVMWNGHEHCAFHIDVEVPAAGVYDVEVVAWAPPYRQYGEDGFARLSVVVDAYAYQEGDSWYRDMRIPGFDGEIAPHPDTSVQWLAKRIAADDRFAEATVRFWWPAIMGSEIAEFPEESSDADFEGRLLAANAQDIEVARLAGGFRSGFPGSSYAYNLKDLLTEIVLSEWFRADAVSDGDPVRRVALRDAGARRLLAPEELARKTAAITGVQWRRARENGPTYAGPWRSALTREFRLLYGGIDSEGITERARDLTSVMAGVAKRHAVEVGCSAAFRDFYLVPDGQRRLFAGIKRTERGANAVKAKIVELHDKLLGDRVEADSADVEAAYQLFVEVAERGRRAGRDDFESWRCDIGHDHRYFEGILDNVVVRRENERAVWWEPAWDRIRSFMKRLDHSDPHHTAQAWAAVLTAMLMDYRYLYL